MNTIHLKIIFFTYLFFNFSLSEAQENTEMINIQFAEIDYSEDNGTFCATIQVEADNETIFQIGTSSILFNYDSTVIEYISYTPINFNGTENCIMDVASAWDPQQWDATSVPGIFNITLTLISNDFSCPTITRDWIDVGTVCFQVLDSSLSPNLVFSEESTSFNSNIPNNGSNSVETGTFGNITENIFQSCPTANLALSVAEEVSICPSELPLIIYSYVDDLDNSTYQWSTGDNSSIIGVYYSGVYTLNINFGNNCEESISTNVIVLNDEDCIEETPTSNYDLSTEPIKVFPTLSTNYIQLEIPTVLQEEKFDIKIYDLSGKLYWQGTTKANANYQIDTQSFPIGQYIIQLYNEKHNWAEQFIKVN